MTIVLHDVARGRDGGGRLLLRPRRGVGGSLGRPEAASRMSVMTHQSYGPLSGVPAAPRLARATPGHRDVLRAGLHGAPLSRSRSLDRRRRTRGRPPRLPAREPRRRRRRDGDPLLGAGSRALYDVAGVTPLGYRAPMWELNYRSARLLHDHGFLYDSSLMDADHPYELATGLDERSIVEIPIHWALDDWEQYCYVPGLFESGVIESPTKAERLWSLELAATAAAGGCFVLTAHPPAAAVAASSRDHISRFCGTLDDAISNNSGTKQYCSQSSRAQWMGISTCCRHRDRSRVRMDYPRPSDSSRRGSPVRATEPLSDS